MKRVISLSVYDLNGVLVSYRDMIWGDADKSSVSLVFNVRGVGVSDNKNPHLVKLVNGRVSSSATRLKS